MAQFKVNSTELA